jgi:sugar lactone lactonase YvrE
MDNSRIRKVDTNGFITTVAGNGSLTYSGDGGAAINASLNAPDGLALDPFGNLYIADTLNNRIRKVDVNGNIITVAGNGTAAYAGDGGSPTSASLNRPTSVASDAAGNLYIADASNNRIRKVYPPGDATLVLANVTPNHAGGYSVVVTSPYGSVTSVVATLTVEAPPIITAQPASQTALLGSSPVFRVAAAGSGPFGYLWYFNSTNLLQSSSSPSFALANISAASAGPYTVVVTNAYGSVTSQVATLALLFPPSVITPPISQTVLPGTNVSLSVTAGGTGPFSYQWRFNGNNLPINIITTVAGNGSGTYAGDGAGATNASLKGPFGVALDAAGNLYIADTTNNRIRMVGADGIITTIAGNGTAGYAGDGAAANNARLSVPCGIVLDASGNLYITDQYNQRIRMVGTNGIITTVAGTFGAGYYGDGGAATNARLSYPRGLALGAPGNLYIALPTTAFAWSALMASSPPSRVMAGKASWGTAAQPPRPLSIIPLVCPWTPWATCISQTPTTIASARWLLMGSSPPWRATGPAVFLETAVPPPTRAWGAPSAWPWTTWETSLSLTPSTIASASWTVLASSALWLAMASAPTGETAARPATPV